MKENRMKPKRAHNHAGPDWQGKVVNTGETRTVSKAKTTSAQVRPFTGKVFYLDLQSNRTTETLESDIKELGGTVEKFLSKEIKYLVSNKREAKYVHCLRQDSPVPSPDSGPSSPHPQSAPQHPVNHVDKFKTRPQSQADTLAKSRGKSLVEKVVKGQGRVQMDRILSNALEWGVKVLYIDDVLAYVQKKKNLIRSRVPDAAAAEVRNKPESSAKQNLQKLKGGRIRKPFIKVEDSSKHYRPIYLTMTNMPEFNLKTKAPCSPFSPVDKDPPGDKPQGHRGGKASASEEKAQGRKKNRDKKRGGYCECCKIKYSNFKTHLQSECHRAFSKTDEYSVVDRLVSALHFDFIPIRTKVKRPKCSVSSPVFVARPSGETDKSAPGGLSHLERTVEPRAAGASGGMKIKNDSSPASAPPIVSKRDCWNCNTYSNRPKHRSPSCKQTFRQKSSTCAQTAKQVQIPQLKSETSPSRGEFQVTSPLEDSVVHPVDRIPRKGTKSPPSFLQTTIESDVLTKSINVGTQPKGTNTDESCHGSNTFSETGNNRSDEEEARLKTPDSSLVRRIQRKIRVYKHKRRKVDVNIQRVESSDVPENSLLKLWDLFQSSDDMDVEFYGFED
nr:protein DBF4 homolog A [Nothobranchius furzeri]XP_054597371.1 protein DBF4 homolog A [Nothobranchius furzeri]